MKNLKKKLAAVAVLAGSSTAFAAGEVSGIDVAPVVTAINGVVPSLIAIGGAVLAVVVVAWGYKVVKGFLGR